MIIGIGIDQVQIERIRNVSPRLFARICTDAEREYCERFGPEGRFERYAGRFAAKEALSKALGTGIAAGVEWKDLEILPTASGAPVAHLHGKAADYAQSLGATRIHVSITHDKVTASAIGILEGPGPS